MNFFATFDLLTLQTKLTRLLSTYSLLALCFGLVGLPRLPDLGLRVGHLAEQVALERLLVRLGRSPQGRLERFLVRVRERHLGGLQLEGGVPLGELALEECGIGRFVGESEPEQPSQRGEQERLEHHPQRALSDF